MFRTTVFAAILAVLCTLPAYAEMRIAVMDFEVPDKSLTAQEAAGISELVRTEMINIGLFRVIERAQVGKVLREQGFQQTGCTDVSCAVQIGQLLSAKKILVGSIMKMGDSYIINGRIVDVEKGTADYSSKEKALSKNVLDKAVEQFVIRLADNIALKAEEKELAAQWKKWKDARRAEESKKSKEQRIYIPGRSTMTTTSTLGVYSLTFMIMGGGMIGGGYYFKTQYDKEKSAFTRDLYLKVAIYLTLYPSLSSTDRTTLSTYIKTKMPESSNKTYYQTFFYTGIAIGGVGAIMGVVWAAFKIKNAVTTAGDFKLPGGAVALVTPLSCRQPLQPDRDIWHFPLGVSYQF